MKTFSEAGPSWSGFFLAILLMAVPVMVGCQTQSASPAVVPEKTPKVTNGPTRSYLGLTKKEATAKARSMGLRSRIVREGFTRYPITKDLRQDRINFEIDDDRVTLAKIF